ncbi:hypothetical protein OIU77_006252 [Salix suchowensis]|uniref:Uncharacterized protein n=1 Tax=Salix suchowensis TaxID=1278906 RepID=A0ABQ9AL06_9ROSI|nr:hypothetical protein OIU77_006252 [Salix suchowensis]
MTINIPHNDSEGGGEVAFFTGPKILSTLFEETPAFQSPERSYSHVRRLRTKEGAVPTLLVESALGFINGVGPRRTTACSSQGILLRLAAHGALTNPLFLSSDGISKPLLGYGSERLKSLYHRIFAAACPMS